MKQIKFLAAALAALTMLSCSKDGSKGPDNESSSTGRVVTINFANLANSGRSVGPPTTEDATSRATLSDAGIYFVTASNTVVLSRAVTVATELAAPILCTNVPNNATKVYIVANYIKSVGTTDAPKTYPAITDANRVSLSALKQQFTGVTAESQAIVADVMMDGSANITPTTVNSVTTYAANVAIAPLVARIEVAQFTLTNSGTSVIDSYDLEGVFVNNVYQNLDLSAGVGNNILLSSGTLPFDQAGSHPLWFKDWSPTGFSRTDMVTLPDAGGNVWGYSIFPAVKSADEKLNLLPQLIFRINNVVSDGATIAVPKYFTVMKFKESTPNKPDVTAFARNKCYKVTNVRMDHELSVTDPEVSVIDVTVEVIVSDWEVVTIEPA